MEMIFRQDPKVSQLSELQKMYWLSFSFVDMYSVPLPVKTDWSSCDQPLFDPVTNNVQGNISIYNIYKGNN